MIILEFFCEKESELFSQIPKEKHFKLVQLYFEAFNYSKFKPQHVKICVVELIRAYFIKNDYENFDVMKLIDGFTKYYHKNPELKLGFIDDLNNHVADYLFTH